MLTDTLGLLVAFCSVMLLLSLVVTALAQTVQAGLRLRGRNLLYGVEAALGVAKEAVTDFDERRIALQVVDRADTLRPFGIRSRPVGMGRRALGPRMAKLSASDFQQRVSAVAAQVSEQTPVPSPEQVETATKAFDEMGPQLRARFGWHMRVVSVACAALVAIVFQVDTLALLRKLSTNAEYRALVVQQASTLMANEQADLADMEAESSSDLEAVAAALAQLKASHPDMAPVVDPLLADPGSAYATRSQLAAALAAQPDVASQRLAEFDDALALAEFRNGAARAQGLAKQMVLLDLNPWADPRFYDDPRRLLGVLLTIILLSLGAPFWYEQLKRAGSLGGPVRGSGTSDDGEPPAPHDGQLPSDRRDAHAPHSDGRPSPQKTQTIRR